MRVEDDDMIRRRLQIIGCSSIALTRLESTCRSGSRALSASSEESSEALRKFSSAGSQVLMALQVRSTQTVNNLSQVARITRNLSWSALSRHVVRQQAVSEVNSPLSVECPGSKCSQGVKTVCK
jgi:hypothetical protein